MNTKSIVSKIVILAVLVILLGGIYVLSNKTQTVSQPSITVLSPQKGERVKAGSALLIKWTSINVNDRVLITVKLSNIEQLIAPESGNDTTVENNGSFLWKVSRSFDELNNTPVDRDYPAYIIIKDSKNGEILGKSEEFTITPEKPSSQPDIKVISPDGGENWKIGQTYSISTLSVGELGARTIILNRYSDDGVRVGRITIGTTESDNFSYKIPVGTEQTTGSASRYKIQVFVNKYDTGRGVADESDNYFTITK